ncbi:hypothetical protein GCM10009557_00200 [Virgisporangium ochraceum]|uniref:XRE family transcriptional regulator n=1 Tax=Virgisporangium ochraceum TaxID=65505 RepID=A0A8J4EJ91_9ACTN|nr:hypothetical protein [Virgisporangium ochraceum]GIJ74052.1 hypothetical protein Voc01_089690 [Virgisporangium ochraceum]
MKDRGSVPNRLLADARRRMRPPHGRGGAPLSRTELADAVNAALDHLYPARQAAAHYVDHSWVGKLERGEHRWPSAERRAALRRVLNVDNDEALGLTPSRRRDDRAGEVSEDPVAITDSEVDDELAGEVPDTVEAWLHELDDLTSLNRPHTSDSVRGRVRRHLTVLERLRRGAADRSLAGVDARWSEFMSWISDNTGDPNGDVWLSRSHRRASDAGDQPLIAYTLMRQSQRALDHGDARRAIELSRQSLTLAAVPPRTRVLCLSRMAEGLACAGDDDAFLAMSAARRELGSAMIDAPDTFAQHCDLRYVTAVDARCRQLLGDPATAAEILETLLTVGGATSPIDTGVWHAYLGECYLPVAPERAAQHGEQALQLARTAGSYRVVRATQPLVLGLRRHGALTGVRPFLDAYRVALTGR